MTNSMLIKPKLNHFTSGPDNFGWAPLAWAYQPD